MRFRSFRSDGRRVRRGAAAAAVVVLGSALAVAATTQASAAAGCRVTYSVLNQWPTGFTAALAVTNLGDPLTSWQLTWTWPSGQSVTQSWNGEHAQTGSAVTLRNAPWNGNLGTNATVNPGFNGAYSGTNTAPTSFALNGTTCTGAPTGGTSSPPTSPTPTPSNPAGQAPTVALTSPADGASFTAPATVNLAATASDADGTVARVEFYNGTALIGTDTSSPYSFSWTGVAAGSYSLTAKAIDNTNLATTSAARAINVNPPGGGPVHVDNPYVGARGYVNPDWAARASAEPGGSRVANVSTGVWMDRIAAIAGTAGARGMRAHLDNALVQAAGQPLTIQFVIYNLPNRDCSALASNGELLIAQNGLNRYKSEYIDPIAQIMADPRYASLRIVTIIEIDSLPNLITNLNVPACQEAQNTGAYVEGVRYALNKLHAIPNVYTYVDAAHHGWLGWDTNFGPAAQLFATTAQGTTAGFGSVDGFITNTANYSALSEPYFTINSTVNGQTVRQSRWVDWNFYIDELTYAQAFRNRLVQAGFSPNIGMLIDTSRNGWGGAARPTGPSPSTDLNTFVNGSRVDRRIHAGNWCNQSGAGMGERPRANPAAGIDAYVWIKPPGESDGSSEFIPNDQGKGFDRMCDPTYGGNARNGNNPSGALPNAPISGAWFSAQFQELMRNAFPPLS